MKKSFISASILLSLVLVLGYNIYNSDKQRVDFKIITHKINNLTLINKDFDLYLKNSFSDNNFDIIQKKIDLYESEFQTLENSFILQEIKSQKLETLL